MKLIDTVTINKIKLFTETNFSAGILNINENNKTSRTIEFFEDGLNYDESSGLDK